MCLLVTNKGIQTAKKNIECYKFLYLIRNSLVKFKSKYEGFSYKKGKVYTEREFSDVILSIKKNDSLGSGGFHSYRNRKEVELWTVDKLERYDDDECVAVKCIIPKGSRFIYGEQLNNKQYFSEKIIIKEILLSKSK